MTNSNSNSTPDHSSAPTEAKDSGFAIPVIPVADDLFADGDPRRSFAHAVAHGHAVLGALDTQNADRPSPCDEWTAGDVGAHLVAVLDRVECVARGGDVDSMPLLAAGDPAAFQDDFAASAERAHAAWADAALLEQMVTVPWGQIPGAIAVAVYTAELLTHTWDLATAIDVAVDWDDDLAAESLAVVQFGIPAEGRGPEMPFGEVAPLGDDADNITRLAAWMGRRP